MIATKEAARLFHEGTRAFAQVESNGMRIDLPLLDKTTAKVGERIKALQAELKQSEVYERWRRRFGDKFSFDAGQQLGEVLVESFDVKLPLTKTGKPKTDVATLQRVDDVPFVPKWFEVRKLLKLRNYYLRAIKRETTDEGLLHGTFNLHTVVTYRSSSGGSKQGKGEVNLQNLPSRDPLQAKLIKRLFIPRDGHDFCEVDLKANEVRVACCYTEDPRLIEDTLAGDMHRDMAAELFMVDAADVSKTARHLSKNGFVFAEFYGDYWGDKRSGASGVARNLWERMVRENVATQDGTPMRDWLKSKGIKRLGANDDLTRDAYMRHVKEVEERFWNERYTVYTAWKKRWWADYLRRGEFRMLTGFVVRRNTMGLPLSKNECLNSPIQGSAFHCDLWVLIELQKWLRKHRMRSLILGQVHDSIIIDLHRDERDDVLAKAFQLLRYDIRKAWPWLICPLEGECEIGPNWYEKREVEIK